jgi:glyoxylate reductase
LNANRLAQLPDGAVVVNVSRGNVIDDMALVDALKSGKIYAAGLDVFEGEPNICAEYYNMENVFMLPHIGSSTVEAREGMAWALTDGLRKLSLGQTPKNQLI